ncbi:type IV toxin-antitoxin system AbiEi family antitoxin domain-containing protein [Lichenibacterium ramalinae]|uniref:Uncharacterized protein n=1 Tax=Lichenibacterium ramalinae TaxID=2316527 RepID=A0A4Q2R822_9HYPH|nr:hypothetical protein [Lichenibacterium ramalinae]RYB01893.1 hypothetical protein D3272_23615 [Lichenibacterium ramalinae]
MTDVMDGRLHLVDDLLAAGFALSDLRAEERAEKVVEYVSGVWISHQAWMTIGNGLDQAAATLLHPGAIVCFHSAMLWHLLGDDDPPRVFTSAIPVPGVDWNEVDRTVGVDVLEIAGVTVRVTSAARTVVDMLRFREVLCEESARAALVDWRERGSDEDLLDIARILGCEERIKDDLEHVPPLGMCWRY